MQVLRRSLHAPTVWHAVIYSGNAGISLHHDGKRFMLPVAFHTERLFRHLFALPDSRDCRCEAAKLAEKRFCSW